MKLTTEILRTLVQEEVKKMMTASEMEEKASNLLSQISSLSKNEAVQVANSLREKVAKLPEQTGDEVKQDQQPGDAVDESCGAMQSIDMNVDHHNDDHEGSMAKRQMFKTAQYATEIFDNIHDGDEFPAWIQSKMTKIADYIGVVKHYLEYDHVMGEKLDKDATAGDYVKDFRKSKAPQFKGKSKKKKQEMAIAAYLDAQEDK